MKVLVLFAHPALHKSYVNKVLIEEMNVIDGVTFHDLYELYPEFDIDVSHEQDLLSQHDCIVFHHPLFWYSTPALLKEWQDLVLQHDWAFGSKGNALKGKLFFNVVTVGGPRKAYQKGEFHNHSINELLSPLTQTAALCKMTALPPFVVHGTHAIEDKEIQQYKNQYFRLLELLATKNVDVNKVTSYKYLNDYLKELEG
ncbi:NAD(P)H oxidoreductase [Puteibacter caeruleilacunae]|nr:NAD(P)H oxidoreductase [Puteibacter caeruleilacunae]